MSVELHTVVALLCIIISYCAGYFFSMKKHVAEGVNYILDYLRTKGYISIRINKDGEQELITINELIVEYNNHKR